MPSRGVKFDATVKLDGINPYVDVPAEAAEALPRGKAAVLVRVRSKTNRPRPAAKKTARDAERLQRIHRLAAGGWFRTTLVPQRAAPRRLFLNTWMRESAGAAVGDVVEVTLRPDDESREISIPPAFREALAADAKAKRAWDALRPSNRQQDLAYLHFLKTPEALERNVAKLVARLHDAAEPTPATLRTAKPAQDKSAVPLPDELRAALAKDARAREAFDRMPPSHRRRVAKHVAEAKQTETRERRSARAVEDLKAGRIGAP